ncbi:MAG TPA: hypothetical protein VJS47_07835 [Rhizomicrobium sp.]|nr:hypothetical protein [Rhizomicrobium sp.]
MPDPGTCDEKRGIRRHVGPTAAEHRAVIGFGQHIQRLHIPQQTASAADIHADTAPGQFPRQQQNAFRRTAMALCEKIRKNQDALAVKAHGLAIPFSALRP